MRLSGKEQGRDIFGETVEVDNDRLVSGKERLERLFSQSVRVNTAFTEDEKIGDVYDSNSDTLVTE